MLIEVSESSQAGEARRRAVACAEDLRFDSSACGAVAIATTEMATNLVKHAGKGSILLQPLYEHDGNGLGAIQRLSDAFDVYSVAGVGTVVRADFWIKNTNPSLSPVPLQIGVVSEPVGGEDVCGDGWGIRTLPGSVLMMVADGLVIVNSDVSATSFRVRFRWLEPSAFMT